MLINVSIYQLEDNKHIFVIKLFYEFSTIIFDKSKSLLLKHLKKRVDEYFKK